MLAPSVWPLQVICDRSIRSPNCPRKARKTPVLANLRPSGKYLMEDFFYAGGLRAFLGQLGDLIDLSQMTCNGQTLGANIANAKVYNDDVCLLYTSPSPRDRQKSRMPSS